MAGFRVVILLWHLLLLTSSLELVSGKELPKPRPAKGCDCDVNNEVVCDTEPCISIKCRDIDTEEKVRCAQEYLQEVDAKGTFSEYQVHVHSSDLDLFPDDFFETHPVTWLSIVRCAITEIPQRLINPLCHTLTKLRISSEDALKTIREGQFSNCTGLEQLDLSSNRIEELSPKAVHGLKNLKSLVLSFNKITSFKGLEGVPELFGLDLSHNRIKYVDKNAFRKTSKLTTVRLNGNELTTLEEGTFDPLTSTSLRINLKGNPLNCNCSIKWLKNWSEQRTMDTGATCGPDKIPLKDMDMSCKQPTDFPEKSTGQETESLSTDKGCDCETDNTSKCFNEPCISITCHFITTKDKVRCAQQYLKDVKIKAEKDSFVEYQFKVLFSNLDLFPEDFFESYPVTYLFIAACYIPEIPHRFISPVCHNLTVLRFSLNVGLKSIEEGEFSQCPHLQLLQLSGNEIQQVSPEAFYGLSNLKGLDLGSNNITSFKGLRGIPQLRLLILSNNRITYIDKNAFLKISKLGIIRLNNNQLSTLEEGTFDPLTSVNLKIHLEENPLRCDCSLKWLQNWSNQHNLDTGATCAPDKIPLEDMDISCDEPSNLPEKSTGQEIESSSTDKGCDCEIDNPPRCFEKPCISIHCVFINTKDQVRCAQQYLKEVKGRGSFLEYQFAVSYSALDLFPEDFFESYPVTFLSIFGSGITEIPHRFITLVRDTLTLLEITKSPGLKTIVEGEFSQYTHLQLLSVSGNEIQQFSPEAFSGLSNLKGLNLGNNKIQSFKGLEGIPQLLALDLSDNRIKYIDKNAFRKTSKLDMVHLNRNELTTLEEGIFDPLTSNSLKINLQENPLRCDCSLKWLQNWSNRRNIDTSATCGPTKIPLQDSDISCKEPAIPEPDFQAESIERGGCDCTIYYNPDFCISKSCEVVECKRIKTKEMVQCVHQFLRGADAKESFNELHFYITESDLELFPDDFFTPYPVATLRITQCRFTEIPHRLITPVCDTLTELSINFNPLLKTIGKYEFSKCTSLQFIFMVDNGIEELSPMAFHGLYNLKAVLLIIGHLTSFHGLEGIPQLRLLGITHNRIKHIDKNAFQKLRKLDFIRLEGNELTTFEEGILDPLTSTSLSLNLTGNPLNCDCSLRWMQEWAEKHSADILVNCGPKKIPLKYTDLNHCALPGQATRNFVTFIIIFISVLMFALNYFECYI